MTNFLFFVANILILAGGLAVFEIKIEKNSGWGSGWQKNKWYSRPFAPKSLLVKIVVKLLNVANPLNYHAIVFGLVLPLTLIIEYFTLTKNVFLLLACFVGVTVFEDMFWFILNWHFDSLRQLLKGPNGGIWWHHRWMRIYKNQYLPVSYATGFLVAAIFLLLSLYW